jgi:hypothetical protein
MRFFNASQEETTEVASKEAKFFKKQQEIEKEIISYSDLLSDPKIIKNTKSTSEFWKKNRRNFLNLYQLQTILLNIPASSAFIERFFSISGIVSDIKRLAMKDELIIMRSMTKANMSILRELNQMQ